MVDIQPSQESKALAATRLREGGVAVLPTETVYGLFGRTDNVSALGQIYALKGRPSDNPLIAHVLDVASARTLASRWPTQADQLCEAFWPGPLTVVVPKHSEVPDAATSGLPTVAIRSPRHKVTRAVMEAVGVPLSAPSANRSGSVSPTCVAHVERDYQGVPEATDLLVLDGGCCQAGLESTVIDVSGGTARLLRVGSVPVPAIEAVLGVALTDDLPSAQGASPGTRSRHYATNTPLMLADHEHLAGLLGHGGPACVIGPSTLTIEPPHIHLIMPDTHQVAAKALYSLLRDADATETTRILVIRPPQGPQWRAIHDRLERAAERESGPGT